MKSFAQANQHALSSERGLHGPLGFQLLGNLGLLLPASQTASVVMETRVKRAGAGFQMRSWLQQGGTSSVCSLQEDPWRGAVS